MTAPHLHIPCAVCGAVNHLGRVCPEKLEPGDWLECGRCGALVALLPGSWLPWTSRRRDPEEGLQAESGLTWPGTWDGRFLVATLKQKKNEIGG